MHIDLFGIDQRICTQPKIVVDQTLAAVNIPHGHVGPVALPGTGRLIYWTGRVAIGLRHQPATSRDVSERQQANWLDRWMHRPSTDALAVSASAVH